MISVNQQGPVLDIRLNRPDKRNAVRLQMLEEMAQAIVHAQQQLPALRLIVVRGEGSAFSAGLDLQSMGGIPERFGDNWTQFPHVVTRAWQQPLNTLANSPVPTLAMIHGYCLGAGLEIALACDFRYATVDAQLSLAETRIGLIPDVGGTTRLVQMVGVGRAREMIYTSRRIDAHTAERWGLVNKVVASSDSIEDDIAALASELTQTAPLAVAAAKRVIQGIINEQQGLYLEALEQAALFSTEDLQEGIQSVLERRAPQWKGR